MIKNKVLGAGLVAAGVAVLVIEAILVKEMEKSSILRSEKEKEKAKIPTAPPLHSTERFEEGWDEVDQASWDSFPASDPPSHSSFT